MFQNKEIIALIPLRGGSKSIPYKNIKEIAGRPLCYWVLSAAKESKYIDGIYVSTEDVKIKETVLSFDLGVKIMERAPETATDTASTESVAMDFMGRTDQFDILALIQATSPLLSGVHLDAALERFFRNGCDSMVSGVLIKRFFWTKDGQPLNYDPLHRPRRQNFNGIIMENGAFYITKKEIWEKYNNRLGGKIGVFEMPEYTATELDEPDDWVIVEDLLLKYRKNKI